jgi:hypothetical protein
MAPDSAGPPFDQFLATAEAVARARPEVDLALAPARRRGCSTTASPSTVWTLTTHVQWSPDCAWTWFAEDPGAAVRARSRTASADTGDLHDPDGVSAAYLSAASILQL